MSTKEESSDQNGDFNTFFDEFVDKSKNDTKLNSNESEDEDTVEETESDEEEVGSSSKEPAKATKDQPDNSDAPAADGYEKRYKDLQSYADRRYNTILAENKALADRLAALEQGKVVSDKPEGNPKPERQAEAEFKVDEYLKTLPDGDRELFEENPALLRVMADVTRKLAAPKGVDSQTVAELVAKELEKRDAAQQQNSRDAEIERMRSEVLTKMPDAPAMLADLDFQIWREDNKTRVDHLLKQSANDAEGVMNVLKYYKSSVLMTKDNESRKRSTIKGTASAPKGVSTQASNLPSEDDYEASFEYFQNKRR
jgi:hypothetical protein